MFESFYKAPETRARTERLEAGLEDMRSKRVE